MRDFELERPVDAVAIEANNPAKPGTVKPEWFFPAAVVAVTALGVGAHVVAAVAAAVYLGYIVKKEIKFW